MILFFDSPTGLKLQLSIGRTHVLKGFLVYFLHYATFINQHIFKSKMPRKRFLSGLVLILGICLGCLSKKEAKALEDPKPVSAAKISEVAKTNLTSDMTQDKAYFRAGGPDPDWNLEISQARISLATKGDTIYTPHTEPDRAMDANIKRYRLETESTELIIQINQKSCESGSGEKYPYQVVIQYRPRVNPDFTSLSGCGTYIMDYRLHDIWALESLNETEISIPEGLERPHMEIDTRTNEFMGTTSCNQMRGKVFFEPGLLRFNDVITTRKMCPGTLESDFLKALQSTIHYSLGDNRLRLTNPNGTSVVFRKTD